MNGKTIIQKDIISNDNLLLEYKWFYLAQNNDISGLSKMLSEGFSINSIILEDNDYEHIGFKAVYANNKKLLNFFLRNNGDIYKENIIGDNLITATLAHNTNYTLFKMVWNIFLNQKQNINWFNIFNQEQYSVMINDDKNLLKIKFLFHFLNKNLTPLKVQKIKTFLLKIIKEQFYQTTPKIRFFLEGKEELYYNLKNNTYLNNANKVVIMKKNKI